MVVVVAVTEVATAAVVVVDTEVVVTVEAVAMEVGEGAEAMVEEEIGRTGEIPEMGGDLPGDTTIAE